jgi:Fe-S cluster biogenesis protein NfuA
MSTLIPTYVYTEMTPNPNSMKFVADRMLIGGGDVAEFQDSVAAREGSPLALALFEFPFVKTVFIMGNFVTVSKDASMDWDLVKNELREFIQRYLMEDKPVIVEGYSTDIPASSPEKLKMMAEHKVGSELEQKIADLLDEYVRPAVEKDGGAIQLDSFQNGVVSVVLRGSCSGCPSSTATLKGGIENLLTSMMPEVREVVAING